MTDAFGNELGHAYLKLSLEIDGTNNQMNAANCWDAIVVSMDQLQAKVCQPQDCDCF